MEKRLSGEKNIMVEKINIRQHGKHIQGDFYEASDAVNIVELETQLH